MSYRRRLDCLPSGLFLSAALALATLLPGDPARATLLVYEPFDYTVGSIDGVTANALNLTGDYAAIGGLPGQEPEVAAPGLAYGSLTGGPPSAGNRLTDTNGVTAAVASVDVATDVVIAPGGAIFFSALFTLDDSLGTNHLANITLIDDATGDFLFFGEPAVGSGGVRVAASTTATGGLLANGADNAFVDGDTLLLIGRYVNSAAANGDVLQLLGFDSADAEALPASFDPLDPNAEFLFQLTGLDIDMTAITSITFTIRGSSNNHIDELRIGDTYASVVPEPAVIVLLLTGIVALGSRGRRRRPTNRLR